MTQQLNSFEIEMYRQLIADMNTSMDQSTAHRNEKTRWMQGYKSGRKNERKKIRDAIMYEMCGYGNTFCECDRCSILMIAVNLAGGVSDV